MYIIIGAKAGECDWQKLSTTLGAVENDTLTVEDYYARILSALAHDDAATTSISLPQDKDRLAELASGKQDNDKLVLLGVPVSGDSKLLDLLSSEFNNATFLLLYRQPELAIARLLEEGNTSEQAARCWLEAAQPFLHLHRHHRQHSCVLDVERAIQSPDEFFKLCKQHYGLSGSSEPLVAACREAATETPDILHVLVAKQLLQQSEELAILAGELAASTSPLGDGNLDEEFHLDLDLILQQQSQLSQEKQDIAEENELLLTHLFHTQEELERYYLQSQDLQQEKSRLEVIKTKQAEEKKQLQKKLEQTQKTAGQAHQRLASIQQTLVYRLTRPVINWQRRLATAKGQKRDLQLIEHSDYFDTNWYLQSNADVRQENMPPALHYLLHGGFERRDPGPRFSSRAYLQRYPDVATSGVNPLVHYVRHGEKEGRRPK